MLFNPLQAATLTVAHATLTRVLVSFTLRTYQYLEWNSKRRQNVESITHLQEFQKAQVNESEYAALIAAPLFYLALIGNNSESVKMAATLAVTGQVGYVWMRTAIGYPKLPTIAFAIVRYAGLGLIAAELWNVAFVVASE